MLVYRLEQSNGEGPFRGNGNLLLCYRIQKYYDYLSHPTPQLDGIKGIILTTTLFGCVSIEYLRLWFAGSEMRRMTYPSGVKLSLARIAGYNRALLKMYNSRKMQISVYRINKKHVQFGSMQVAFESDYAKLVRTIPVEALFTDLPL